MTSERVPRSLRNRPRHRGVIGGAQRLTHGATSRGPGGRRCLQTLAGYRGRYVGRCGPHLVDGSTVQRRIGRLERALDVRLFDRTTRGFALTPQGQELVPHAEALEAEVQTAVRKVGGRGQQLHGVIRLETTPDFAASLAPATWRWRNHESAAIPCGAPWSARSSSRMSPSSLRQGRCAFRASTSRPPPTLPAKPPASGSV